MTTANRNRANVSEPYVIVFDEFRVLSLYCKLAAAANGSRRGGPAGVRRGVIR